MSCGLVEDKIKDLLNKKSQTIIDLHYTVV